VYPAIESKPATIEVIWQRKSENNVNGAKESMVFKWEPSHGRNAAKKR
jgi:hypothetical protein